MAPQTSSSTPEIIPFSKFDLSSTYGHNTREMDDIKPDPRPITQVHTPNYSRKPVPYSLPSQNIATIMENIPLGNRVINTNAINEVPNMHEVHDQRTISLEDEGLFRTRHRTFRSLPAQLRDLMCFSSWLFVLIVFTIGVLIIITLSLAIVIVNRRHCYS